jgi:heat shock protein HslJ
MKITVIISTVLFLLTSACSMGKKISEEQTPLYDTKWSLKKIYTGSGSEEVNTKAFIRFDQAKGSAGGNGSCNSFGSTVTVSGNTLSFKNIFSTKMYCEGVQQTENAFFSNLEKANSYEIDGKTLKLFNDKELILEFIAI